MPPTVSDVIASRVREFRKRRGLSIDDLAGRCAALGAPELTTASLTNVERPPAGASPARPRRAVPVPELFVLAQALDVPPILLMTPIGQEDEVEILPGVVRSPHHALRWIAGRRDIDWPDVTESLYTDAAAPIRLFDRHEVASRELDRVIADTADTQALDVAAERLENIRESIRSAGLRLPPLSGRATAVLADRTSRGANGLSDG